MIRINKNIFFIILIYLLLSTLFHGIGLNLIKTILSPGDAFIVGYPTRIFSTTFSLWNPYIQCGASNISYIGFQTLYPVSLFITYLFPNPFGYNLLLIGHYALSGIFTFLFLTRLNLNRIASFAGGVCFMFCGFLAAHKGHHTMVNAAIWLPLVLYFVELFFNKNRAVFLLLAGAAFSMCVLADYIAIPMYIGMIVFPYICFKVYIDGDGFKDFEKIIKIFKFSIILFGVGLLLSTVYILPIIESLTYVTRESIDYKFFSSYGFRWHFLPTLLFPHFYGSQSLVLYPIQHFVRWNLTELNGYMGILPIVSAFLCFSLYRKKNLHIYFWSLLALVAFILVLGNSTPVYKLMFHVPIYNMFRAPARNWYEVNFAVAVLFAYFINYAMLEESKNAIFKKHIRKGIKYLLLFTFFIILIIIFVNFYANNIVNDGGNLSFLNKIAVSSSNLKQIILFVTNNSLYPLTPAVYIPLLLIGITTSILILLPKLYQHKIFWYFVIIIVFLDLFSFGHFHDSYYGNQEVLRNESKNEIFQYFQKKEKDLNSFRFFPLEKNNINLLYPEINLLYGLNAINGYGAIIQKDYTILTGFNNEGFSERYQELLKNPNIISSLSVKYLLSSSSEIKKYIESLSVEKGEENSRIYIKRFETSSGIIIYENKYFLPRVRFVSDIYPVSNSKEAEELLRKDLNCNTAYTEGMISPINLDYGKIISVDYSNDEILIDVNTGNNSFLVLSDSYYPGWKAYVDDKETRIYKTNGFTRGIIIKGEGQHRIIFAYKPNSFFIGLAISFLTLMLLVIMIVVSYYHSLKRRYTSK